MSNSTGVVGWVPSDSDRGSLDIFWSCCLTIALCVWVSTHPNVPSPKDKWYHEVIDKLNLACIGMLGPDYLALLAAGQLMNARRSVKKFRASPEIFQGREWTLTHAFFADMGGFVLASPDYPDGFPINAEQLYYLMKHQHVEFPTLTKDDIERRNKSDDFTKLITLCQVCFFLVNEFWRIGKGYPITTLELTTITFSFLMFLSSLGWYYKPVISAPTILRTRDNRTVKDIRRAAKASTHPNLQHVWYRTPLAFISHDNFHFNKHWQYYANLSYSLHLPIFGREIKTKPWDRIPSDIFYPPEFAWPDAGLCLFGLCAQIPFSLSFLGAWFFEFPSKTEQVLWRVCACYHAAYSIVGALYYTYVSYKDRYGVSSSNEVTSTQDQTDSYAASRTPTPTSGSLDSSNDMELEELALPSPNDAVGRLPRSGESFNIWVKKLRNNSPNQDPDMEIPLRWTLAFFFPTVLYIFCRAFFYVEDIISLRSQPAAVYSSVERLLPFI